MDNDFAKEMLAYDLGSDLHNSWCDEELLAYFERAKIEHDKGCSVPESLKRACFKNGSPRNEIFFDVPYLVMHEITAEHMLDDYESFKLVYNGGGIDVFRFVKRNLNDAEIKRAGNDYHDGKENILRSFDMLSADSQKENLYAAIIAINLVFDYAISGKSVTKEQFDQMASVIHEEWLKRNAWVFDANYGNPALAVSFDELSEDEKNKDRMQLVQALDKVQAYLQGRINIDDLADKYVSNQSKAKK